jgi:hypothetical protein
MSQFKFKDFIFNKLFTLRFHTEDTYKTATGKGILQRFLEIGSEYFDDEVISPIDNYLDIIDVDKTPEPYLNILWEYFGYLPYAYGIINIGKPFTKADLATWINNSFPLVDHRNLLKYAISLYKIRCTAEFYTILGKFYNIEIYLEESAQQQDTYPTRYNEVAYYNRDNDYDQLRGCLECVEIIATIKVSASTYQYLEDNNRILEAQNALIMVLNKYLPINVKPLTTNTLTIVADSNLNLLYIDSPNV